jgi:hypothetical protein
MVQVSESHRTLSGVVDRGGTRPLADARVRRGFAWITQCSEIKEKRLMRRLLFGAALAAMLVGPVGAQRMSEPTWKFGGTLGLTLPLGNLGDVNGSGFHITGLAQGKPAWFPLTVRGEAGISTTGGNTVGTFKFPGTTFVQVSGNGLYHFDTASDATFKPYVIGGVGFWTGTESRGSGLMLNAGGGFDMKLAGFDAFAEAKLQPLLGSNGSAYLLPISFGLRF